MKKTVKLITEKKSTAIDYELQLKEVFGDSITVLSYTIDEANLYDYKEDEIILTAAYSSPEFQKFKKKYLVGKILIPIQLSLQKKYLYKLDAFQRDTPALLVNITKHMAEETIAQIYQSGYCNLSFYPYYPGGDARNIKLAVTCGEMGLVPDSVTESIDLGARLIDVTTIVELAEKMNCEYLLRTQHFFDYFARQFTTSAGVSILIHTNQLLEQQLSTLIQIFDKPLVCIDKDDNIFDCNFSAVDAMKVSRTELLGNRDDFLKISRLTKRCRLQMLPFSEVVKTKTDEERILHVTPVTQGTQYLGAYAWVAGSKDFDDGRFMDIRASHKGHSAKYSFADINGNSAQILKTVELAKKMARTESSVLITGESGTGKELFAHAIHNSSSRAEAPFVAINCAALPNNLLESELFGYEDGAFTGAKKGGKVGLFELANTGSVFLDEIEGMDLGTQLKLLRVIQEKEMIRVGGDRIIPIDVRIISASNQDMISLIEQGKFRQDFYYRIGTLPLDLPPLRKRKEDILPLMESFKNELRLKFILTEEAKSMIMRHSWPGNIRELRNCVEYMGCHNIPVIGVDELPLLIKNDFHTKTEGRSDELKLETAVMKQLTEKSKGRGRLQRDLSSMGIITEAQLRRVLEDLKEKGFVESEAGRKGSSLTKKGVEELKNRLE